MDEHNDCRGGVSKQDRWRWSDATAIASAVREGVTTPAEQIDLAYQRIERLNPAINAVVHRYGETDAPVEDAVLTGVPTLLKDLGASEAGRPHTMANRRLAEIGHLDDTESHIARKIKAAGLIVLGRTNAPELGMTATTEPEVYGPTRNPWSLDRLPGGSSGGAAAAVASGMVPVAHGSDGGGSIRLPASCCGVVGLKSSRGRVSAGPGSGEEWAGLAHQGMLTRTVRDTALTLDVISGAELGDPYPTLSAGLILPRLHETPGRLRVMVMAGGADVDPEISRAVLSAASVLESLGHQVEERTPVPLHEPDAIASNLLAMFSATVDATLRGFGGLIGGQVTSQDVEPVTWYYGERGRRMLAADYIEAVTWMHSFTRRMAAEFVEYDLLLLPTMPERPPLLGEFAFRPDDPEWALDRLTRFNRFTCPFNLTGQPAISLPLARFEDGLPLGIQFVARYAEDELLLRVAYQMEEAMAWADRHPKVGSNDPDTAN
jgi:amidase